MTAREAALGGVGDTGEEARGDGRGRPEGFPCVDGRLSVCPSIHLHEPLPEPPCAGKGRKPTAEGGGGRPGAGGHRGHGPQVGRPCEGRPPGTMTSRLVGHPQVQERVLGTLGSHSLPSQDVISRVFFPLLLIRPILPSRATRSITTAAGDTSQRGPGPHPWDLWVGSYGEEGTLQVGFNQGS